MRGRFGDLLSVEVSGANLSKQEENSLVKRSQKFESGETGVQEFHRLTSFQMPTLALAGHCDYPLAGYKTLLRYLKATGFKGEVRKCHIESTLDTFGSKMVFNRTMRVSIRILGVKQLPYIDFLIYPKVEQDDFVMKVGNFAMHLDEACEKALPASEELVVSVTNGVEGKGKNVVFPNVNVPNAGMTLDLAPYPCIHGDDGGRTKEFIVPSDLRGISKERFIEEMQRGVVYVEFSTEESNHKEVKKCYGTKAPLFIPHYSHPAPASSSPNYNDDKEILKFFVFEDMAWRSFKWENVTRCATKHYEPYGLKTR